MRRSDESTSWVVYRATFDRRSEGMAAVCDRDEWVAMEQNQPGRCTLLKDGFATEGEAEQFARTNRAGVGKACAARQGRTEAPSPPGG